MYNLLHIVRGLIIEESHDFCHWDYPRFLLYPPGLSHPGLLQPSSYIFWLWRKNQWGVSLIQLLFIIYFSHKSLQSASCGCPPQCKLSESEVTHIECGLSVKTITLSYFHPACTVWLSHLQELYDPWMWLLTLLSFQANIGSHTILHMHMHIGSHHDLAHAPGPSKVCHRKQHYLSKLEQTIQKQSNHVFLSRLPRCRALGEDKRTEEKKDKLTHFWES